MWPAKFYLSSLNGTNGFIINGTNPGIMTGTGIGGTLDKAGDINADGIDDIIIGAYDDYERLDQSYVIFGSKTALPPVFNIISLDGDNGFALNGTNNEAYSGPTFSVAGIGDVNNDGIGDVIVGAWGANNFAGQSYVVFGSRFPSKSISLAALNGYNGFTINGIATHDYSGCAVAGAGDVNNDGIADIIIGAEIANNAAGQSYIIFGSNAGFSATISLSGLNGNNGFTINGISANDFCGASVKEAGDINADGITDVIIGAPHANNGAGQSYVLFGKKFNLPFPAVIYLSDLNGSNGFIIDGINSNDYSGSSVSGAGDINGDNIADIIIYAPGANNQIGQSYIIFGSSVVFPRELSLAALYGNNGFTINGFQQRVWVLTIAVNMAGDVNNDGIDDIIIGDPVANNNTGQSYVIFGNKTGFPAAINLSDLNGSNGFTLTGINANDYSGTSVGSAGDINADSIDDIMIGAIGVDNYAGQTYVIFGHGD